MQNGSQRASRRIVSAIILVPLLATSAALGANKTWTNPTGGTFNDGTKWSPAGTPTSADSLIINAPGADYLITVPTAQTAVAGTLTLDAAAAALQVQGSLTAINLNLLNGIFDGTATLGTNATLTLGDGTNYLTGTRRFRPVGNVALSAPSGDPTGGQIFSNVDLLVRAAQAVNGVNNPQLTAGIRPLRNDGTLTLDAAPTTNNTFVTVSLGANTNALTNNGTLKLLGGSSSFDASANTRTIAGRLVNAVGGSVLISDNVTATTSGTAAIGDPVTENSGSFIVEQFSTFTTPSFRQAAGSLQVITPPQGGRATTFTTTRFEYVNGTITGLVNLAANATLATANLASAPSTFQAVGNLILDTYNGTGGNIPAGMTTGVAAGQFGGSTSVTLGTNNRSFTNAGTLYLAASSTSQATSANLNLGNTTNTLTNAGTLIIGAGSTAGGFQPNVRTIQGSLNNAYLGTVNVAPNVTFSVTGALTNAGTINFNSSFSLPTGFVNTGAVHYGTSAGSLIGGGVFTNNGLITGDAGVSMSFTTVNGQGSLILSGGSLTLAGPTQSLGHTDLGTSAFNVNANQTITVDSVHAGPLTIANGGKLTFRFGPDYSSRFNGLSLNGTNGLPQGTLDIANKTIIDNDGTALSRWLQARVNGKTGLGLKSEPVTNNPALDIGIARADQVFNSGSGTILYEPVTGDDVIIRVTLKGDANLDGTVNFDDLIRLAQHYNQSTNITWADGDADYNGKVNFDDLISLAQNYNRKYANGLITQAGSLSAGAFAADWALARSLVPEPTTIVALAAPLAAMTRRRR